MTLDRVPKLAPDEARLRETVLPALCGRRCADGTLTARIPRAPETARWWYACPNGVSLAVLTLGGREARLIRDDGVTAAETLDACEAVLREIELGLGIDLVPERLEDSAPAELVVDVAVLADRATTQRLLLAIPHDLALHPASPQFAPELLSGMHVAVTFAIVGPRLAPHDAAALARGDLLLLGGPLAATLSVPGQSPVRGRFDPAAATFLPA